MKNGQFQTADTESEINVFTVEVYPSEGEAWYEHGKIRFIVYNTGDVVYFDEDGMVETVTTHDGLVFFRSGML